MPTDFECLDRWRAGDRAAGNELLRRHFDSLYRFFSNKVDQGVDDLIQRTFLACIESKDRFRKQASFRTYLFTVARHELYRHFRKGKRFAESVDVGEMSVMDLGTSPSRVAAQRQEHKLLLRALRRIPLDLQLAVELFYWEGMTTAELAEVLEVPQGTAKSRLRRAREALELHMRQLAESPSVAESTLAHFDAWAAGVRAEVGPQDAGPGPTPEPED
ncbi:MAG: sigma-70 family RNA polymerase sigma factor [Nannocystaceae bacterium]